MRHFLSTILLIALSFGLLHAQGEKALLKARKYEAAGEKQWPKALSSGVFPGPLMSYLHVRMINDAAQMLFDNAAAQI